MNTWLKWALGIGAFLLAAAILFPIFAPHRGTGSLRSTCQSNLKQIALGFKQYIQDSDEKYPLAISGGASFGWADAIQPYTKSTEIYHCPTAAITGQTDPRQNNYTDYWYNGRLAGVNENKFIPDISSIFLNGEGNDGSDASNARYSISALPKAWRANPQSPANRHLEGANYTFDDGHVKWLKPQNVKDDAKPSNAFTFAIS